ELPEYMLPAYMMSMDQLPVTRNGKLDRQGLPEPALTTARAYTAPRNETEQTLADIYQEVLGADRISVDDHFFDIGGHSLSATRVINLIEARLGTRLPLKMFFENPTVAQLSAQLSDGSSDTTYHPIAKADPRDYYPMSSPQKRLFIINELDDAGTV